MKKILLTLPIALMIISACGNGKTTASTTDADSTSTADSVAQVEFKATGIAIDGAMNSISIKTADGDTVGFGYPEIAPENKTPWMIGDTVTVTYIKVNGVDSVLTLRKGTLPK